ncbi:glycosyltransferase family 28 protein [Shimia sp. CNT1-13L.2]|uniref:glycosyltransferase n=1 Tax=Shimia sp. CNT1-13L.2 TaxID=2959663 RepID=UPI0020CDE5B9|nr:glycosyltransferase [Shimia sp. CNT1-13L.2]MCP9481134.1 glycosyltransferase family 28 protein [Shimia sp. CNT1-13L.2]
MIFVTVGTQLPFDRLLGAVDVWAEVHPGRRIVAQSGESGFVSDRLDIVARLERKDFRQLAQEAAVIVSHAGMGTILTALELCKPVIILPRRADLGEHRNDHQHATAERLGGLANVRVIWDESDLGPAMDAALQGHALPLDQESMSPNRMQLLQEVRSFISDAA